LIGHSAAVKGCSGNVSILVYTAARRSAHIQATFPVGRRLYHLPAPQPGYVGVAVYRCSSYSTRSTLDSDWQGVESRAFADQHCFRRPCWYQSAHKEPDITLDDGDTNCTRFGILLQFFHLRIQHAFKDLLTSCMLLGRVATAPHGPLHVMY
jgi:hypothetical protein